MEYEQIYTQDDWTVDEFKELWLGTANKEFLIKKYFSTRWDNYDLLNGFSKHELQTLIDTLPK